MTASRNESRAATSAAPTLAGVSAATNDALRRRLIELAGAVPLAGASDLAAGLTHELNQPLCAIVNYAEACLAMLSNNEAPTPVLIDAIGQIRDQAARAGDVMRRLRDVLGRRTGARMPCDVNALVTGTLELMHAAIERHGGRVSVTLADELPPVLADAVALQHLFASVLRCGLEAMSELDAPRRRLTIVTAKSDGRVSVAFSDARRSGTSARCAELFEPLGERGGMCDGLNLALGRAMLESLGGRLWGAAGPDGGMTFTISLPAAREE